MLSAITNNPFRLLGVFSNAPQKDIVKNISRMNAYLNVGKDISFTTDYPKFIGELTRTAEQVASAQAAINLPADKITHALFWFINNDPVDEVGLNHLANEDFNKAEYFFYKRTTFSSLINRAVLALLINDIKSAAHSYETLLSNSDMLAQFVSCICGENIQMSKDEISQIITGVLCEDINTRQNDHGIQRWRLLHFARIYGKMQVGTFRNEDGIEFKSCIFEHPETEVKTYVRFSNRLGELTPNEIAERKQNIWVYEDRNTNTGKVKYILEDTTDMPNAYSYYELTNAFKDKNLQTLIKEKAIQEPLAKIHSDIESAKSVNREDSKASLNAGLNLKTSTILHLNKVREIVGTEDSRYIIAADNLAKQILQCGINYFNNTDETTAIDNALDLQKFALNLAVGKLVKDRCKQNVDILLKRKEEAAYAYDINAIVDRLKALQNASPSVATASQFVDGCAPYLANLKTAMGSSNSTFIQISSAVANNALNMLIEAINKNPDSRPTAKAAQDVMLKLSSMVLDAETRKRVASNSSILAGNIARMPTGFEKADRATGGCLGQILGYIIFGGIIALISGIIDLFS